MAHRHEDGSPPDGAAKDRRRSQIVIPTYNRQRSKFSASAAVDAGPAKTRYTRRMPRSRLLHLKVLVLGALLVSGGGGLPVLDIALFHAHARTVSSTPHFEAGASPHAHGDRCTLGTALLHTPIPVRLDLVIPVVGMSFRDLPGAPDLRPPSTDLGLLPQPRAPPDISA